MAKGVHVPVRWRLLLALAAVVLGVSFAPRLAILLLLMTFVPSGLYGLALERSSRAPMRPLAAMARVLHRRLRLEHTVRHLDIAELHRRWNALVDIARHAGTSPHELDDAMARTLEGYDPLAWTAYLVAADTRLLRLTPGGEEALHLRDMAVLSGDDSSLDDYDQVLSTMTLYELETRISDNWGAGLSTELIEHAVRQLVDGSIPRLDAIATARALAYTEAVQDAVNDGVVDPSEQEKLQHLAGLLRPDSPGVTPRLRECLDELGLKHADAEGEYHRLREEAAEVASIRAGHPPIAHDPSLRLQAGEVLYLSTAAAVKRIRKSATGRGLNREEFEELETVDTGKVVVTSSGATFAGESSTRKLDLGDYLSVEPAYRNAVSFTPRRGRPFFVVTAKPHALFALLDLLAGGSVRTPSATRAASGMFAGLEWCLEALELGDKDEITASEVKKAHRSLAADFHPDRGGRSSYFRLITEARDRLLERLGA